MSDYNCYSTKIFTEVWDEVDKFVTDLNNSPFAGSIKNETANKLFYLLYQKYGNNPIANRDENQFKMKVFGIIFEYGSTWEKRLEIQTKLRGLTEEELVIAGKSIHNHANNPSTDPYTASEDTLSYIDDQNVNTSKRGKLEAYSTLWAMLEDITEPFLRKFEKCFKLMVNPVRTILYPDVEE